MLANPLPIPRKYFQYPSLGLDSVQFFTHEKVDPTLSTKLKMNCWNIMEMMGAYDVGAAIWAPKY